MRHTLNVRGRDAHRSRHTIASRRDLQILMSKATNRRKTLTRHDIIGTNKLTSIISKNSSFGNRSVTIIVFCSHILGTVILSQDLSICMTQTLKSYKYPHFHFNFCSFCVFEYLKL